MTEDIDFDSRELCPDDACIGVLDAKGVCPECGKSSPRKTPFRSAPEIREVEAPIAPSASASSDDDAFSDDDRELCPDDACIGLIGPNGRCKECGRARQS